MLHVFQIKVTQHEANSHDPAVKFRVAAKQQARNDLYWNNREDFKFESWWQQCFTHVANVDTACPDEAFHIMNLWGEENEEKVTRIGPLHSLSVGDVLVDELTGNALLCAPSGWTAIDWEWNDYDDYE